MVVPFKSDHIKIEGIFADNYLFRVCQNKNKQLKKINAHHLSGIDFLKNHIINKKNICPNAKQTFKNQTQQGRNY